MVILPEKGLLISYDVQGIRSNITTKNIKHPTRTDKLFRSDRRERYHPGANKTLKLQSLDLGSGGKPTSFWQRSANNGRLK